MGKRAVVKALVSSIISGRVMSIPSALEPVVKCFPALARGHPREFIRLVAELPLTVQRDHCWPAYIKHPASIETLGSSGPLLNSIWRMPPRPAVRLLNWCVGCLLRGLRRFSQGSCCRGAYRPLVEKRIEETLYFILEKTA